MATRIGGARRKSRKLMTKKSYDAGKLSLKKYFQVLKAGEKVKLVMDSGIHSGTFHRRFYGRVGVVGEKQGSCYSVKINDGKKQKMLIVHPIHLQKV
jgi:large subunit ribosomal protein L21e